MAYENSNYLERRRRRLKKIRRRRKIRRAKQAAFLALCILTVAMVYGKITKKEPPFNQKPENGGTPEAGSGKSPGSEELPEAGSSLLGKVFENQDLPWYLTLVNEANPLPDGFTVEVSALKNGLEFDSRAIAALQEMIAAGNREGLSLIVCSAYRPMEKQQALFQAEIDENMAKGMNYEEAYQEAKTQVAVPGSSEHSLGLAADICSLDHQILDDAFADTKEAIWLAANAEKYGFILRYPKDKQDITGIIFEPWHFRYVGVEDAKKIKRLGFCLEEYVFYLAADQE